MNSAQVNSYVGLPYREGGFGPDAYNCWGLVTHIEREFFDIIMPFAPLGDENACLDVFKEHVTTGLWQAVSIPKHGDGVLLRGGSAPHVGVYLCVDNGGVLHALEGIGVVFTELRHLAMLGFARPKFYRMKNAS